MTNFPVELFKDIETPFYYYDTALLKRTLETVKKSADSYGYHIHYAIKANTNPGILAEVTKYGFGVDCVSGGEIRMALQAGFAGNTIMYAGVGKTDKEIEFALDSNIRCFNVESLPELENINAIAARKNCIAHIAMRINPNIDAHTHQYITTGLKENKFGISMDDLDSFVGKALEMKNPSSNCASVSQNCLNASKNWVPTSPSWM